MKLKLKDPWSAITHGNHTFYRHADGNFRRISTFNKSSPRTEPDLPDLACNLCSQPDFFIRRKHNLPYL